MDPAEQIQHIKSLLDIGQLPTGVEANPTELPGGFASVIRAVLSADTEGKSQDVRAEIARINDERMRALGEGKLQNERLTAQERTEQALAKEQAMSSRLAMELQTKERLAQLTGSQAEAMAASQLRMAKERSDAKIREMLAMKQYQMSTVQDLLKQAKYEIEDGGAVRMGPNLQTIADQIRMVEGGDSYAAKGIEQQVTQNRNRMTSQIVEEILPAMKEAGMPVTEDTVAKFRKQLDDMIAAGADPGTARQAAARQSQQDIAGFKAAADKETEALAETRKLVQKGLPVAEAHRLATDAGMHPELRAMAAEEAVAKVARSKTLRGMGLGAGLAGLAAVVGSKLFSKSESQNADPAAQQMQMIAALSALRGQNETQQTGRELANLSKTLSIIKMLQTMGGMGAAAQSQPSLAQMV